MQSVRRLAPLGFFCIVSLLGAGCSGGADASEAEGDPAGEPDPVKPPASCVAKPGPDLPDDSFEDANCDGIDGDRAAAIFASPSGSDASPGTLEAPVRTIAKAVATAIGAGKYVIVANGDYPEALVLEDVVAPLAIYGGYVDKTWERMSDRATIAPASGIPLTIRNVTAPITIDRLAFVASDATEPSGSSVAVFAADSKTVTLTHVRLQAGSGADGVPPPPLPPTDPSPGQESYGVTGASGESTTVVYACNDERNGPSLPPDCQRQFKGGGFGKWRDGVGWGGIGGSGALPTTRGTGGAGGTGGLPGGGVGGVDSNLVTQSRDGQPGAEGVAGAAGEPGTGVGLVTANGYTPANAGSAGTDGKGGAGGGGGAGLGGAYCRQGDIEYSSWLIAPGGGQGGHGGRGGQGAPGSPGGGASIGLLVFNSDVSLVSSSLTTVAGGRGADATSGTNGLGGGIGGNGGTSRQICFSSQVVRQAGKGGNGGRGGRGGAGGAGGGGPSIAILYAGTAPKTETVAINVGSGGKGGSGLDSPNGADGLSRDSHEAVKQ